jgi:hypothetical protein
MNKKGVSVLISYVLLISIAVALSIGVYSWLRFYVSPGEEVECLDGADLIIEDYDCLYDGFNLTVKNMGLHYLDGYRMAVHDRSGAEFALYVMEEEGVPLPPGDSFSYYYPYSSYEEKEISSISLIEIAPFIEENGEKILCEDEVAVQTVSCAIGDGDAVAFSPPSGILSWWRFDNNFTDSVGDNNLTNYGNSPFVWGDTGNGQAVSFNGEDQYVQAENPIQLEGKSYTIALWANLADINQTHTKNPIFIQIGKGGIENESRIFMRFTGNLTEEPTKTQNLVLASWFRPIGGNNIGETVTSVKTDWKENEWYFVTGTYNSDNGNMSLYVNGDFDNDESNTPNFLLSTLGYTPFIGKSQSASSQNFNGSIDEVMIFDRVLDPSEIKYIYDSQKGGL